MEGAVVVMIVW